MPDIFNISIVPDNFSFWMLRKSIRTAPNEVIKKKEIGTAKNLNVYGTKFK